MLPLSHVCWRNCRRKVPLDLAGKNWNYTDNMYHAKESKLININFDG